MEHDKLEVSVEAVQNDTADTDALAIYTTTLTAEDVQIPRVRLAQPLTPEVIEGLAQPGMWITPLGTSQQITFKLRGVRKLRALRESDTIACASDDGITGKGVPGGTCAMCPKSKWVLQDGKSTPPECVLYYEYLIELLGEGRMVATLRLSTKSARNAIHAINTAMITGQNTRITLGSQIMKKGMRSYYVPVMLMLKPESIE